MLEAAHGAVAGVAACHGALDIRPPEGLLCCCSVRVHNLPLACTACCKLLQHHASTQGPPSYSLKLGRLGFMQAVMHRHCEGLSEHQRVLGFCLRSSLCVPHVRVSAWASQSAAREHQVLAQVQRAARQRWCTHPWTASGCQWTAGLCRVACGAAWVPGRCWTGCGSGALGGCWTIKGRQRRNNA